MKQGLVEWAVVTAILLALAAGAAAVFGHEIRGAFGVRPTPGAASRGAAAPSP
ncbi:MAG TPA: hypothetical protein VF912_20295 [Anaeromyxobacter sp.]